MQELGSHNWRSPQDLKLHPWVYPMNWGRKYKCIFSFSLSRTLGWTYKGNHLYITNLKNQGRKARNKTWEKKAPYGGFLLRNKAAGERWRKKKNERLGVVTTPQRWRKTWKQGGRKPNPPPQNHIPQPKWTMNAESRRKRRRHTSSTDYVLQVQVSNHSLKEEDK